MPGHPRQPLCGPDRAPKTPAPTETPRSRAVVSRQPRDHVLPTTKMHDLQRHPGKTRWPGTTRHCTGDAFDTGSGTGPVETDKADIAPARPGSGPMTNPKRFVPDCLPARKEGPFSRRIGPDHVGDDTLATSLPSTRRQAASRRKLATVLSHSSSARKASSFGQLSIAASSSSSEPFA